MALFETLIFLEAVDGVVSYSDQTHLRKLQILRFMIGLFGIRKTPPSDFCLFIYLSLFSFVKLFLFVCNFVSNRIAILFNKFSGVLFTVIQTKILLDVALTLSRKPEPDFKYVGLVCLLIVTNILFSVQALK